MGLTHALNISEYVMLLDVKTGLVYWMDCPEEILKAFDPQPSLPVYPLEGEAKAEQNRSVVARGRGGGGEGEGLGALLNCGGRENRPAKNPLRF